MASHVHVLSSNCERSNSKIHYMPCRINRNGPAKVSTYFLPTIAVKQNGIMSTSFRGYPLFGKQMDLPEKYSGFVLQETQGKFNEEVERNIYVIASFDKFTYWNYDEMPSAADQINSIFDWITISSVLHSTTDLQSTKSVSH